MEIKIEMVDPGGIPVETQTFKTIVDIFECREIDKVEVMPGLFTCREEPMKKNRYIITIGESVYRIVNNQGMLERIVPKEDNSTLFNDMLTEYNKKKKLKLRIEGFINESKLKFNDISSELEREYTFPNGNKLLIKEPLYLHVSASGGHRLYDGDGYCHYVQPTQGWSIKWKVKEGEPNFVK